MKLKYPFKGDVYISSPYGTRILNGVENWHSGLDLVGMSSKNIYAPCDGVIGASTIITDTSNRTWEWGNYVRLDTADGYNIYMCHMSTRLCNAGDKVKQGDLIGVEGNTGYSFGSHCHFEIRKNGVAVNPAQFEGITNKAGITVNNTFDEKVEEKPMTKNEILKAIGDEFIETYSQLPEWAKPEVRKLLDAGIINGGTANDPDDINMFMSDIKTIIICQRIMEK